MTKSPIIARRELASYFHSPIAYVAMTLFLLACGFWFRDDFQPGQPAEMRSIFTQMIFMQVLIIPLLCMGLIAQEWATSTIESLMTAPVDESDVVVGKFLGGFGFFVVMLAPTLLYVLMLRMVARPDLGPILSGYLGILLVGALFVSVSLFCSSLTKSQIVAAVSASAILFLITIAPWWASSSATLSGFWRKVVDLGVYAKYADFTKGVIDTGGVVYFLALTGLFLFLTTKVLESRRWK